MGKGARRKEAKSSQKAHVHRYFWEVVDVDRSHLYEYKTVQGTRAFHSVRMSDNAIVEMWTRKISCFCNPCSSGEWDNYESTDWVNCWDDVSLPIGRKITAEFSQLEEGELSISHDYDHISYLIQPSSTIMLISLKFFTTSCV